MKRKLNKLIRGEKGQALVLVMVLMLLAGLIIAPLLAYLGTGLKVGKEVYEERMYGQYAADAGVQDALYRIRTDDPALPWGDTWDESAYATPYPYSIPQLNGNDVDVTIQPYWILTDLEEPHPGMTPHSDLVIVGDSIGAIDTDGDGIDDTGVYQISINFTQDKRTLMIERIGAWLPAGYEYVDGSSNLEQAPPGAKYRCDPTVEDFRGGKAIKWDFGTPRPKFEDFPDASEGKAIVTFQFTPLGNPVSAFSWVLAQPHDIYLSWDADIKIYQITSVAEGGVPEKPVTIAVDAWATKNEPRKLGSGMSGDYVATGNSLMMPDPNNNPSDPGQDWRSRLLKESDATITTGTDIPANAKVEGAYLYWSGWIDHFYWYQQGGNWRWSDNPDPGSFPQDNKTGLVYPDNPTQQKLTDMVEEAAKVNTVNFGAGGVQQDITAQSWQVWPKTNDSPACWYYTCFYDATTLVKQLIADNKLGSNGSGTYTLGHATTVVSPPISHLRSGFEGTSHPKYETYRFDLCDKNGNPTSDETGYPLGTPAHKLPGEEWRPYHGRYHASYAGWSLIVIYSSPDTKGHQLYLYDIGNPNFTFKESYPEGASESNPDFDGDGSPGGTIRGFLVPPQIPGEVNAAKMTCFVGEGDKGKTGDSFKVTGPSGSWAYLLDGVTGTVWNDVWNSQSVGITAPGVDIDTFYVPWYSGILNAGDTWAQVDIPTVGDGFTLSYIILSFRSETKTGGTISYVYVGG